MNKLKTSCEITDHPIVYDIRIVFINTFANTVLANYKNDETKMRNNTQE